MTVRLAETASDVYRRLCDFDWENEIELVDDLEEYFEKKLKLIDYILSNPEPTPNETTHKFPVNAAGKPIPPPPTGKLRKPKPKNRKRKR